MNRMSVRLACQVVLLVSGLAAALTTRADVLSAMQILREGGCGGTLPAARPLQHSALLDQAAEQWAAGRTPAEAARRNGYEAESTAGLHICAMWVSISEAWIPGWCWRCPMLHRAMRKLRCCRRARCN